MNCNTTHYRANSSSVPGDPTNSIGREAARASYGGALLDHLSAYLQEIEPEERAKIQRHPLGALDAKDPKLQAALVGAPSILDHLEPESRARFDAVVALLDEAGVRYEVAPEIVRGLDYYTETVFEIVSPSLPGLSLAGGGRYDRLVEEIGGAPTPAAGFGLGIERAILCLEALGTLLQEERPDVFVVSATPDAVPAVRAAVRRLRDAGRVALWDVEARSLKSQLRQADASGAREAVLIGKDELAAGTVTVRDLAASEQRATTLDDYLAGR